MAHELTEQRKPRTPMQQYGDTIEALAKVEVARILTGPDGAAAAAGVALAFRSAVAQAENPDALLNCSQASIAMCVMNSARYRLLPGGTNPTVYLVPKAGQLGFWVNHRGMLELAKRSGYYIECKPHFTFDKFTIRYGLNPDLTHEPGDGEQSWDALKGVYAIVYSLNSRGGRGDFVDMVDMPKSEIIKRRNMAGTQKVWNTWAIPQSIKTCIKYVVARGMVILNDESRAAMDADDETRDVIDAKAETLGTAPATAKQKIDLALGLDADPIDYAPKPDEREKVTTQPVKQENERRVVAGPFDAFSADLRRHLGLDPDAVAAWYSATYDRDLASLTGDELETMYGLLKPGGSARKAFEASPFAGGGE